jgi:hypothetical protein
MRSASAAGTQIRSIRSVGSSLGSATLATWRARTIWVRLEWVPAFGRVLPDQGQYPGAAGLFQQFARGGGARIGVGRLEAAGRQLDRNPAQTVPVLLDQQHVVVGVQGDDLDPVRIFQHVIGGDHRAFVGDAIVGRER